MLEREHEDFTLEELNVALIKFSLSKNFSSKISDSSEELLDSAYT